MNHHHVGPPDYACDGCIVEANKDAKKSERLKTIAGLLFLIALVIGGLVALSKHLG